jgi:hypothetical protein
MARAATSSIVTLFSTIIAMSLIPTPRWRSSAVSGERLLVRRRPYAAAG